MKMLIVSALVCAMMVLTRAAPPPEEPPQDETAPTEETPQDETESPLVKTSTDCPSGWSECRGHGYLYVSTPMSWATAERYCQSLGGNLVSVHNIEEYQAIQDVIFRATNLKKPTWIGGCDVERGHHWYWSDGTPFNYRMWCDGEPNYGVVGGQYCLQINFSANKCWNDIGCSRKLPSVCARKR